MRSCVTPPKASTTPIVMPSIPPLYRQETPYSYVPSCLRMVLASLGHEVAEATLRTLCDCMEVVRMCPTGGFILQVIVDYLD